MSPLDGPSLGIALILIWIALFVVTLVLLRVVSRIRPAVRSDPSSPPPLRGGTDQSEAPPQAEAVLLIRLGGQVVFLNTRARQIFHLEQDEIPNLERLARRVHPSEKFMSLCAETGKTRFALDGRLMEGFSYQVIGDAAPYMVVALHDPQLAPALSSGESGLTGGALRTFTETSQAMAASLDLETTIKAIFDGIEKMIPADFMEITIWDNDIQVLIPYRLVGLPGAERVVEKSIERFNLGEGFSGHLIKERTPLLISDIGTYSQPLPAAELPVVGLRSYLGIPLMVPPDAIGTLELGSLSPNALQQNDLDLVRMLAGQAASALHNSLLYQAEQRRSTELASLAALSHAFGSLRDPKDLYSRLVQNIAPLFKVEMLGFLIYNEAQRIMEGQTPFKGIPPQFLGLYDIPMPPNSPAEQLLLNQDVLLTENAAEDARWIDMGLEHITRSASMRDTVLVPLTSSGRLLGYLQASNHQDGSNTFTAEELHLLTIIANQAAPVIENATLVLQSRLRAQRAEALRRIASLASSAANLDEILQFSLQELVRLLRAEVGAIFLVDQLRQELVLHRKSAMEFIKETPGLSGRLSITDPQYHLTMTGSLHTLFTGRLSEEKTLLPFYHQFAAALKIESAIVVPLVVRDHGIGEIWLGNRIPDTFDRNDLQVIATAAGQLAGVVEQSYLAAQTDDSLRRRVEQLTALTRISRELSTTLDLRYLLHMVYDEALQTNRAECGTILLFDPSAPSLAEASIQFFVGDPPDIEHLPLEQGSLAAGEPLVVQDYARAAVQPPHGGVQSALVVPILYQQRVAGLIDLHSPNPDWFDDAAVEITQALAVQASIVLGNALQFQEQSLRGEMLNRQVETLAILLDTSRALQPDLSLGEALNLIAAGIQQAAQFQIVLISICHPQTAMLQRLAQAGIPEPTWEELQAHQQPWSGIEKLLDPQYRVSQSYFIPADRHVHVPEEVQVVTLLPLVDLAPVEEAWDPSDFLLIPLQDQAGNPLGLISLDAPRNNRRPNRTSIEVLEIFAAQAALAIENHRRLDALAQNATVLGDEVRRHQQAVLATQASLPQLLQKDVDQTLTILGLSRQMQRIQAGLEIGVIANRQTDFQGVLSTLGRELLSRMDMDVALIAENTPGGPHLIEVSGEVPSGATPEALFGQRNPLRQVLQDGQLLLVERPEAFGEWVNSPLLNGLEARSFICLPIRVEDRVVAAVLAAGESPVLPFSAEDRQIFQQLARQVAIAVQNLNLLNEARQRLREVDLLLDFSHQIGSLDPANILQILVESALKALPEAQAGSVGLWDGLTRSLRPQAAAGYTHNQSLLEISYTAGEDENKAAWALPVRLLLGGRSRRIDELNFARDYPLSADDLLRYRSATGGRLPVSCLFVPFQAGGMPLGLLSLDNFTTPAAFSAEDEALMASLTQQTALALENARLFQSSERRTRQMQALTRVSGTITSSLQSQELIATLLDLLKEIVPYDTSTLWSRRGSTLVVDAARGFPQGEEPLGVSVDLQDSQLFQEMIRTGQPLSVPDSRLDKRFPSLIELERRSWLGIPLFTARGVTGVIALEKIEAGFYTPEDVQAVSTFASQAGVALSNAYLYEESVRRTIELDQRSQRLALLNRFSGELGASLDTDHILRLTARELLLGLGVARVSGILLDQDGHASLRVADPPETASPPVLLPDAPIFERLRESLGIFNTANVLSEAELAPLQDFLKKHRTRSLLMVPVVTGNLLHGLFMLQVEVEYHFTIPEIELALTISNQAAIALQNARLTESLEQRVQERTAELSREHRNTETLLRVITELSASLDIKQVLNRTLRVLEDAVGAERSVILLAREGPLQPYYRTSRGSTGLLISNSGPAGAPENDIAQLVFRQRQSLLVDDLQADARWTVPEDQLPLYRSVIAVPLVLGEEVLGVLILYRSSPAGFNFAQSGLVEAAARQISVSLNNAELFNLIRDQSERMGGMLRDQQVEASRSRAILEAVADGVLVTDAANRITLFNASAERVLGLTAAQVTGQSLEQFSGLFGKSGRSWFQTIRLWSSDPKSYQPGETYIDQINLENGQIVVIHLAPVFLRNLFLGTVSIFHDVTSEVRIDRLKSEFVANVSHELRTPMTSIKGYVDVLLMGAAGELSDQQKRFLGVVNNNAQRLNILVNDLLDVSQIEAGRVTLNFDRLDLAAIVRDVITDIQRRSSEEGKPMTFSLDLAQGLPQIEGDPERIRQVLHNLVSNSYNYTPQGGCIQVRILLEGEEVRVDVEDNGIGISPEVQGRIFERFYRGEDPLVLATAGTGLGLSITRNLVEMHHGRIWFTSSGIPGKGSTFSFTLPLQQRGR